MRRVYLLLVTALFAVGLSLPRVASAQGTPLCFPNVPGITNCIEGRLRQYWDQNGGLPVFGYPISAAGNEINRDTGQPYWTQWFERNRFELHPENAAPYDVLLGRLGVEVLLKQGRDWQTFPKAAPTAAHFFAQTGHAIAHPAFWTYWSTHGLEFDRRSGKSEAESIALFGLPISELQMETNSSGDTVPTQWFERARFEDHGAKGVLLGLLGNETRAGASAGSISGQVRFQGASAGGVTLTLERCIPQSCTSILRTTTDNNGNYNFTGAPSLSGDELYYVRFLNDPDGGNADDPARLAVWFGPDIKPYIAGGSAGGGSFDIANVALQSPPDDSTQSIPTTFTWAGRGVAGDRYSLAFDDESGNELCYTDPSDATGVVVDEAIRAECELQFDTIYRWYVIVANGDFSGGFGLSYFYRNVTFRSQATPQ